VTPKDTCASASRLMAAGSVWPPATRDSKLAISGHGSPAAVAAWPLCRAMVARRMTEAPKASTEAKSAPSGSAIPSTCGGIAKARAIRASVPRSVMRRRPLSIMVM
jgi:hypothetical protein